MIMGSLKEKLKTDMQKALVQKDTLRLSVLRLVLSDMQNKEKSGKTPKDFTDNDVLDFLAQERKKRRASADEYERNGISDRAAKELAEAELISEYLPEEISEDHVLALVDKALESIDKNEKSAMGQVMKSVKSNIGNTFDGKRLSELVKGRLEA